jgi:hypothetical protein
MHDHGRHLKILEFWGPFMKAAREAPYTYIYTYAHTTHKQTKIKKNKK